MKKIQLLIAGLIIIASTSIFYNYENSKSNQNDFVSDFLIKNNDYQKERVKDNLNTFEMCSVLNPPKLKKKYSKFKQLDALIQNIINKLENPKFDLTKENSISPDVTGLMNTIIHTIKKDDVKDLAYFENNLFSQWDDEEKLNSKPYRLQLVNNLLNSEVYLINYIITEG